MGGRELTVLGRLLDAFCASPGTVYKDATVTVRIGVWEGQMRLRDIEATLAILKEATR